MIGRKRVLVVVPARGGSRGLKRKNLRRFNGIPLVAVTARLIRRLKFVDRAVVSTDSPRIARAAVREGLGAPFRRPARLSGDRVGDFEVLDHALRAMEKLDRVPYDIVVMLQPTCPLRKPRHVIAAARKLARGGFDAVWTVSATDSKNHPLKQLTLKADILGYYDAGGRRIIARQQLGRLYQRNGAAYVLTRDCLLRQRSVMGRRTSAVVLKDPMVSIDTAFDLKLAEWMRGNFSHA